MKKSRDEFEKKAVYDLQNMLSEVSRHQNYNLNIVPDGIFGKKTRQCLIKFQEKNNLEQSGEADYNTWTELSKQYKSAKRDSKDAEMINVFKCKDKVVSNGEICDEILLAQMMLNSINKSFCNIKKCDLNGTIDEITKQDIIDFQILNGIQPSGTMDKRTWDRLVIYYNSF